jgi:hypothetical protein
VYLILMIFRVTKSKDTRLGVLFSVVFDGDLSVDDVFSMRRVRPSEVSKISLILLNLDRGSKTVSVLLLRKYCSIPITLEMIIAESSMVKARS